MTYQAKFDKKATLITYTLVLIFGLLTLVVLAQADQNDIISILILAVILSLVFVIPYIFHPIEYIVTEQEIIIVRIVKNIHIAKSSIAEVSLLPDDVFRKSYRVLGDAGFFGYFGTYSNDTIGTMYWYCSKLSNGVLLTTADKKIVITPDQYEKFINEIR